MYSAPTHPLSSLGGTLRGTVSWQILGRKCTPRNRTMERWGAAFINWIVQASVHNKLDFLRTITPPSTIGQPYIRLPPRTQSRTSVLPRVPPSCRPRIPVPPSRPPGIPAPNSAEPPRRGVKRKLSPGTIAISSEIDARAEPRA
jgi:hypothetical protein